MFPYALMFCMQSSKTSKKTRKIAEETAAAPDAGIADRSITQTAGNEVFHVEEQ